MENSEEFLWISHRLVPIIDALNPSSSCLLWVLNRRVNLVFMQNKDLLVLPPHFRDLHHASHNFDDFLFPIPSCYPGILCSSTLLLWEKERNLSKAFTGQDRVMKNCNVTVLYQLSLKWFRVPSLLGSSQRAWADRHPQWQFLNISWMLPAKFMGMYLNPKVVACPFKVARAKSPSICAVHGVYPKAPWKPLVSGLCIKAIAKNEFWVQIKKLFWIFSAF